MGSRGISTIMSSTSMVHTSGSINDKDILIIMRLRGNKYMEDFKRPAYFGTPLCQKDIHGYQKGD